MRPVLDGVPGSMPQVGQVPFGLERDWPEEVVWALLDREGAAVGVLEGLTGESWALGFVNELAALLHKAARHPFTRNTTAKEVPLAYLLERAKNGLSKDSLGVKIKDENGQEVTRFYVR